MKRKKSSKSLHLPRVPVGQEPGTNGDEFWMHQSQSGAIGAFRQLSNTMHRSGFRKKVLPGCKLKPLFKNHTAPPRLEDGIGPKIVLPGISNTSQDSVGSLRHVMVGNLDNLPDEIPTTVRVYLASNYEDMKTERNFLFKKAVPLLQKFCSEYGLHFQLVDLNWGVEKASDEIYGSTRAVRRQEISDCRRLSLGPHFVALLGDRYGDQLLVTEISEYEFELFRNLAAEHHLKDEDLLLKCYVRNSNHTPPVYILQVMTKESEDAEKLGSLLRSAASLAQVNGKISGTRMKEFYNSGLEEDIELGVFETRDPRQHCLCYHREFQSIAVDDNSHEAATHLDTFVVDNKIKINRSLHDQNMQLKEHVFQHLGIGNCKHYYLKWDIESGLKPPDLSTETGEYLTRLCQDFVIDMKRLVLQDLRIQQKKTKKAERETYQEVLHHSYLCQEKAKYFYGYRDVLNKLESFMRDPAQSKKPFIIHGSHGCGKSALMANIAYSLKDWFTEECVVVLRFLGTTSDSSSIYSTVVSITKQICLAYGIKMPNVETECWTIYQALATFRRIISLASTTYAFERPLFIVLDGIDMIQPHVECLKALWAIRILPTNVHMILSTVPQVDGVNLIDALLLFVSGDEAHVEIGPTFPYPVSQVLGEFMEAHDKQLTENQSAELLRSFNKFRQALHLRVLLNEALHLKSYSQEETFSSCDSAKAVLSTKLDCLEDQFGSNIVMLLVSYITASPTGIAERDLIDVLTTNNITMAEVHQLHVTGSTDVIYFPPILLAKIKLELGDYLEEHIVHGKIALAWKHKGFYDAIAEKYQIIYPGIADVELSEQGTSFTLMLHEHMANMYLESDKTALLGETNTNNTEQSDDLMLLMPQPLISHNITKLQKLLKHLKIMLPVEGLDRIKRCLLLSLKWYMTKLQAFGVSTILSDLYSTLALTKQLYEEQVFDNPEMWDDLEIIMEFFQLARPALLLDTNNLPLEIFSRLSHPGFELPSIDGLLQEVNVWLDQTQHKLLLPLYPCFKPPHGKLRHSLQGASHVVGFLQDDKVVVTFSAAVGIQIWELGTGELQHRFPVHEEQCPECVITGHASGFVLNSYYSHLNHLLDFSVWSTETGVEVVHANFSDKFEALALDEEDRLLMVATKVPVDGKPSATQRCLLGFDVRTKDILYNIIMEDIHQDGVTKIAFAYDIGENQEHIITVGSRTTEDLGLWNLSEKKLEYKIDLGCDVDQMVIGEENSIAVCASSRAGVILVVQLTEGKIIHRLENEKYRNMGEILLTKSGDYVLLATKQGGVFILSVESGSDVKVIRPPGNDKPQSICKLAMDLDEYFLFVGTECGQIEVRLIATGELIDTLEGHAGKINTLNFIIDDYVLSAGDDQIARVWFVRDILDTALSVLPEDTIEQWDGIEQFNKEFDSAKLQPNDQHIQNQFPAEKDDITSVVLMENGKKVITGSNADVIKIWDLESGRIVDSLTQGCQGGCHNLYLAFDEKLLVGHCETPSCPQAWTLKVWELETGELVQLDTDPLLVYCSCPFPDTKDRILTISPAIQPQSGILISVYHLVEVKCTASLHCNISSSMDRSNLRLVGLSKTSLPPDGVTIDTVDVTMRRNEMLAKLGGLEQCLYAVLNYFPCEDTSYFFTIAVKGKDSVQITMDLHEPIHLDSSSVRCACMLPRGLCVTGTVQGYLVVWDAATQRTLGSFCDKQIAISHVGVKDDMRIFNSAHKGAITCVSVSPCGKLVATGGVDGKVKVWNLDMYSLLWVLQSHNKKILTVSFSEDGRYVVSGSTDQTVCVWQANLGEKVTTFYAHSDVTEAQLTVTHRRLVALANQSLAKLLIMNTLNF